MTHSHTQLALVQRLLHIPACFRTEEHIRQLLELTRDIKFFSTLSKAVHEACCRVMKIAEYAEGEVVFNFGDAPDSFCVILMGSVGVDVPAWTALLANTLVKIPRAPSSGMECSKTADGGLSRFLSQSRSQTLERGLTVRPRTPPKAQASPELNEVASLGVGSSFGELGLLRSDKRAATITCKEPTALAVLSKSDFDTILRENQAKLLNDKINFLLSVPAFAMWSQAMMTKCSYYFSERSYTKGEVVYREGEEAKEVFVVFSGEFVFTKCVRRLFSKSSPAKSELQVTLLLKGVREIFGDAEVLGDSPRGATCRCASKSAHVLVTSKVVTLPQDFQRHLQSIHTYSYLTNKAKSEHLWIKDRISGLIEVEKLKREFTEPQMKQIEPQAVAKKTSEQEELIRNLIRFSNTKHKRVVSDIIISDRSEASPIRTRQAFSRSGSVMNTRDRIASALGTRRHPYLTRKKRDR